MFYHFSVLYKFKKQHNSKGFTLIELLVSFAIVTMVSAIVLSRQSAFNGTVLLRNQAYKLALDLRDMQIQAVSPTSDYSLGDFSSTFGVYINKATPDRYLLFIDSNKNGRYNSGDTIVKTVKFDKRFKITGISPGNIDSVSITFTRPNFDAKFGGNGAVVNAQTVKIFISPKNVNLSGNNSRAVEVSKTGQITVTTS